MRFYPLFMKYWWLSVIPAFILGLFIIPALFYGKGKTEGIIKYYYEDHEYVRAGNKGNVKFEYLMIMLSDSTSYGTNVPVIQEKIKKGNYIEKKAKITYLKTEGIKSIRKLEINDELIMKENHYPLIFFLLCVAISILGITAEIAKILRENK